MTAKKTPVGPEKNPHLVVLRARVAVAPTDPGVYRWLKEDGTVLYVGKAKNLRARLKNYVQPEPDRSIGPWKLSLIDQIANLELTVTGSELEALILETNLIKEIRPKYNVLMKDDKNYVYVRISMHETAPSITFLRRMEQDKAKYIGPFLNAYDIRRTLDALDAIYHFRCCKESIDEINRRVAKGEPVEERRMHPCLKFQMGQCAGLCTGVITLEEYNRRIALVLRFLKGDYKDASEHLRLAMQEAAVTRKFEKAAELRDILAYVMSLEEEQRVSDTSRENTDVFGVAIRGTKAQVVVLSERGGKVVRELSFSLAGQADTASDVLEQVLPQYYTDQPDLPDLVIIAEPVLGQEALEQWLTKRHEKSVRIHVPERGKKSHLLELAERNASEKIAQQFAKWEAETRGIEEGLTQLKELLGLPDLPRRIEGYDISHLSGTETVGSMVVMSGGKPKNDQYRSFTIRTLKEGQIDDYASLREVLRRRLRHVSGGIKTELARWKERGTEIGKARKGEREAALALMTAHGETVTSESIDWKQTYLARTNGEIAGMCRVQNTNGLLVIRSLWVDEAMRGKKLGHTLLRVLLSAMKKGKVYLHCFADLEQYYAEIGFRHVLEPPAFFAAESDPSRIVLIYDLKDHKSDTSLSTKPDLIMIDGGKGQLSAAVDALKETELSIPVIGLAKREEDVFAPGSPAPVLFPKDAQGKFLLMRLRDEAHRFANRHREMRGKKHATGSALDEIPGIGDKTKKDLLKAFGSVQGIRDASDADLAVILNDAQTQALRTRLS